MAAERQSSARFDSIDDHITAKKTLKHVEAEGLRILKPPKGLGMRHMVALATFFGMTTAYILRVGLSLAVVAMTSNNSSGTDASSDSSETCPAGYSENDTEITAGEFSWSSGDKGLILSAFYWGYVLSHVPAGALVERFGAKRVYGTGMFVATVFQFLTPMLTRWGGDDYSIMACTISRVIQGLGQGIIPAATHALLAQWSPPYERTKLGALVYSGMYAGTMVSMLFGGFIIDAGFLGGWPGVFYTYGAIALVWLCFWTYVVYDKPGEHPRISQEELIYIERSMCGQTAMKKSSTPWKQILRSKTVWAIAAAQFSDTWGMYTLLTYMPTYMSSVLHFDINDNSLLSALPYFCMMVVAFASSWTADRLRRKSMLSTKNTRRLMNTVGQWIPTVGLLAVSYAGCDKVLTVGLLTFTVAFSGAASSGYLVGHIDIAPNHAAQLMSFCNSISSLAGVVTPYVTGLLTTDESSLSSWRVVFFLAAGIYFVLNSFYLIFVSGTEQPWNRPEEAERRKEKDNIP